MTITLPNTQVPQPQGLPSLGQPAQWFEMGAGAVGDLMSQMEVAMENRNAAQEDILSRDLALRERFDPLLMAQMGLQQGITSRLDTPENLDILASGELGGALKKDAEGREAVGMLPSKIGKANVELEGLYAVRDLQNKFDVVNNAFTIGQMVAGNSLHPLLPEWKKAVGKAVETFGFQPGSPEYEQAMSEWAIPSEATLTTFDKVAKNIALRRDDHMRAIDLANVKGQWAVDTAKANDSGDTGGMSKENVAYIRAISSDLGKLRDARRTILLKRNEVRLQLRTLLGNINDPEERKAVEDLYLNDYDSELERIKAEIGATKEVLKQFDARSPLLYDDEDRGPPVKVPESAEPAGKKPTGKLTPVPQTTVKEVSPTGAKPYKNLNKAEILDILTKEREDIVNNKNIYTDDEYKRRLSELDREIKNVAARKF